MLHSTVNPGSSASAAPQKQAHDSPHTSVASSPRSTYSQETLATEIEPLLLNDAAPPPAYTPPAPGSTYLLSNNQSNPVPVNYGTTSSTAAGGPPSHLQSMSFPPQDPSQDTAEREHRWERRRRMRRGKIIVLVMVFLAVVLGFMLGMFVVTDDSHDDDDRGSPYEPPPSSPPITWSTPAPTVTHTSIRIPPIPSFTPAPLPVPSDPIHTPLPPDLSSRCPLAVHNKTHHFEFNDLTEFSLYELAHLNSFASIRTTGKITLVAGPSDQNTTISVTVSTHATSDSLLRRVKYSSTTNQLSLDVDHELFPIPVPHFGHDTPCILIYVTVAIAPGSGLDNLRIHASDLEVELTAGLSLSVSEATNMTASHAHVASMAADAFIPRRLYIVVSSGSVTGSFPLLDLLHITARSGSVDIDVVPKPADPNSPTSAVLYVGAASGSVAVRYPTTEADLYARDYRITVIAQSGSITGQYIHGSQTQLTTHSGHIDASVTPLGASDVVSFLRTESRSGYTKLELLAPLVRPECLRHMRSRHDVASGGIKLVYPHLWEGTIAAETTNGHVRVDGDGVEDKSVVRQGAREVVTARKGSGDGIVEIQDRSGSIDLWFPPI